jgi:hypothetical protein
VKYSIRAGCIDYETMMALGSNSELLLIAASPVQQGKLSWPVANLLAMGHT